MPKTPYTPAKRRFDLKFLLCGNSGSGKTHLCGTYTAGPVHFYMIDKGGQKTLDKLVRKRPASAPPITVDILSSREDTFSKVWKTLQDDEKSGFFDEMAEQNGLVVFDSLTTVNAKAISEITRLGGIAQAGPGRKIDMTKGMAQPHWGQLLNWMQALTSSLQDLPCACAATVHLFTLMDKEQRVVARYPSVNGQMRQVLGVDFDETYLLTSQAGSHILTMKEKGKFEAKTRVFEADSLRNVTMDAVAKAYCAGTTPKDGPKTRA